jgi:hypothetical protein
LCCAVGVLGCVRQELTKGSKRLRLCEKDTTADIHSFAVWDCGVTADSQVLSKGYRSTASVLIKSHQYSMKTNSRNVFIFCRLTANYDLNLRNIKPVLNQNSKQ